LGLLSNHAVSMPNTRFRRCAQFIETCLGFELPRPAGPGPSRPRLRVLSGENTSGYSIIEGDPGVGKSAILATFVRRSGCVAHFNVRAQGVNTAALFLASVCAQLIARFGLPYTALPPEATQNGQFLAKLLTESAAKLSRAESLVIAVDALDEVDMGAQHGNILFLMSGKTCRTYMKLSWPRPLNCTTSGTSFCANTATTIWSNTASTTPAFKISSTAKTSCRLRASRSKASDR
jgi:hypothetical protein